MDSLIETFHIDLKLLIAQAINFAIVIGVLYYFALRPLMNVLKDRSATVEKSLKDAKDIERRLGETEEEYKATINRAKQEANEILAAAAGQAEAKREEMLKKAKEEIGVVISEEKDRIREEKSRMLKEVKEEVADLVVAAAEKVLKEKLDGKKDRDLIKKTIK